MNNKGKCAGSLVIVLAIIVVVIALGGYFVYQYYQSESFKQEFGFKPCVTDSPKIYSLECAQIQKTLQARYDNELPRLYRDLKDPSKAASFSENRARFLDLLKDLKEAKALAVHFGYSVFIDDPEELLKGQ